MTTTKQPIDGEQADEIFELEEQVFEDSVSSEARRSDVQLEEMYDSETFRIVTQRNDFLIPNLLGAIRNREYMNLNLHMGYHFSTIEALCTAEPNKNYIRYQYKDGGATFDRRVRRVNLIAAILAKVGFDSTVKGDFLDSAVAYLDSPGIARRLVLLGRLTILTKQLDMVLSNDAISDWYTEDYLRKLGLLEEK